VSHLRPVKEGSVKAVGNIIRRTRTLVTHQVDIFHFHGENDELVATARVTNYYKKTDVGASLLP
jgi:acyl-coenzyme A thioesterase PaaI-like protein